MFKAERDQTRFEAYAAGAKLMARAAALRAELRGSAIEKFRWACLCDCVCMFVCCVCYVCVSAS